MPPSHRQTTWLRLLLLTVCVLLVHGILLGGLPPAFGNGDGIQAPLGASFVTRTIAADPPPIAQDRASPAADTAPPQPNPPPASGKMPSAPTPEGSIGQPSSAVAMGATTMPANVPAEVPVAASSPSTPENAPAAVPAVADTKLAAPAETTTSAGTAIQGANLVVFPAPIRLLYDGKGEERGFIKYAASSELLWLHDGAQYSARLEISAWGFRVRTWTSKGELGAAGLAPVRFGDKPRGAELTTHFQRDKGIISFSANTPDVPLQVGAQDKLSALLQLSALVAGAPERYSAGKTIRFQAADAHRAELWDFQVGALELLDLPAGPKQALKFSKAPTAEFDQRIEVWLAPDMQYLPVRLRITEANGAFADLLWRKTQNSE